jgi:hypothetical protein
MTENERKTILLFYLTLRNEFVNIIVDEENIYVISCEIIPTVISKLYLHLTDRRIQFLNNKIKYFSLGGNENKTIFDFDKNG